MDSVFQFLEGRTFYSTLAALSVMAGVWYFWWHILPKIRKYDLAKNIAEVIIPKIGKDIDSIEKEISTLKNSLKEVLDVFGKEFNELNERNVHYTTSFEELLRTQKTHNKHVLDQLSRIQGKSLFGKGTEIGFESHEEVSRPIGKDTEQIMDELTLADIRGIIRNDQTLYKEYDGDERRANIDRRSGRERREKRTTIKDDRRMTKRRSGTDRREENTLGYLKKLSNIVDALQENPQIPTDTLRRRSRIHDF